MLARGVLCHGRCAGGGRSGPWSMRILRGSLAVVFFEGAIAYVVIERLLLKLRLRAGGLWSRSWIALFSTPLCMTFRMNMLVVWYEGVYNERLVTCAYFSDLLG